MKRLFLQLTLQYILLSAIGQEKIAALYVSKNFQIEDYTKAYYNQYENSFRITLQNGNEFTRLLYDSSFKLVDSFSFNANTITINSNHSSRLKFLTNISLNYEAYTDREKIVFIKPDFSFIPPLGKFRDKIIYAHSRFSIQDLSPSISTSVTTVTNYLLDDKKLADISLHSSFLINKDQSYYLGYYSKESKQIEIHKYNGIR